MKKGFVISLLAVLALAGCQTKELDYAPQQESKHFTATIEDSFDGGDTRTYMDENGNVRWKQGDQVSIFAGDTVNEQYQVIDASDGKTSAGFNKLSGGGFVGGGEILFGAAGDSERNGVHSGALGSQYADGGILEDNAFGRIDAGAFRAHEIAGGVGFAFPIFLGADEERNGVGEAEVADGVGNVQSRGA